MATKDSTVTTVIYSRTGEHRANDLRKFYVTLHGYVTDFGMPDQEVKDIQSAVEELVFTMADKFGKTCHHFRAKDVIGVGSFYENTKILFPDEFDFLYVLDELSNEDLIEMKPMEAEGIKGVEAKVKDVAYFHDGPWLVDTGVDGELYLSCVQFMSDKNVFYTSKQIDFFCTAFATIFMENVQELRATRSTGQLSVSGIDSTFGPNVEIWYEWKSKRGVTATVKSDVTPVIRAFNLEKMVMSVDCPASVYTEKLKKTGSYLVMPSKMRHLQTQVSFSPTFTETERDIMLGLTASHRVAYQCLKLLILDIYTRANPDYTKMKTFCLPQFFDDVEFSSVLRDIDYLNHRSFLSTFCLKTALLTHARECDVETKPELCALDVIEILLRGVQKESPSLPSVFNSDNLFWKLNKPENSRKLETLEHVLMTLISFHQSMIQSVTPVTDKEKSGPLFKKWLSALLELMEKNPDKLDDFVFSLSGFSNTNASKYCKL